MSKTTIDPGEFNFAATHLNHPHLFGQCEGLINAGATLKYVFDPEPKKAQELLARFPQARIAHSLDSILEDETIHLVTASAIPNQRSAIGCKVMKHRKDYFTSKCPFTTLSQLSETRQIAQETGQKYMVYYGERLNVESAWYASEIIKGGLLGDILNISIFGPHRLNKTSRPDWFFRKSAYGGILTDLASHQFDQFLEYTQAIEGEVVYANVANYSHPDLAEFEDFGEAILKLTPSPGSRLKSPITCYSKVDWHTPDGMRKWGDGRTFITGTQGTLEIRKYFDIGRSNVGNRLFLATQTKEEEICVDGKIGYPFFGKFILDCLNRTENAMTQSHAFKAAELSMKAQLFAEKNLLDNSDAPLNSQGD